MQVILTEQTLAFVLDAAQYSQATLHKCFYWYTRDYQVLLEPISTTQTRVQLRPKEGTSFPVSPTTLVDQVHNDLIDFKLREFIAEETRPVRELLIAKAFAHFDTEQPLLTDISDPVGFLLTSEAPQGEAI
ncbi:His-Xaa-Ser system protein HxsD [Hymenobacter sp. GOD-10R]|uniref:His-Xaa-Ser system protein HxsD n=1 Tax=Hymenobacter sp. GOD-10R TaxID=3093922 RepID=UPI002D798367|nr:His-Xaa-Ser system protein HxsD [Hymenobacter sp. GOD-10R]WRQ31827.1 His-Xaa-Ser system protein HxsD [Hymenobacter sp. GOD-10R]